MRSYTGVQLSKRVKEFLEMVQPLPVKYGYPRGIKKGDSFISYRDVGSTPTLAVGGGIISERRTYLVTVQTKTAESNLFYSTLIKFATEGSYVTFMSEDLRRDVTVEDGWINSIMLVVYNVIEPTEATYSREEVRMILQDIADNYLFVTSIYRRTLEQSFIDKLVVPQLTQESYTYQELLALKQTYLDKLVLSTTEF